MEAYPTDYVEHNLPLVVLSGLGQSNSIHDGPVTPRQESGTRLVTRSPDCATEPASHLLQQFVSHDGTEQLWNSASLPGPTGTLKYRMKAIGRTYTFPPRKAAPLPQSPTTEGFQSPTSGTPRSTELHSPLSPLSPGSPIFPDGVFTPLWLAKHQHQVPALFLAFFDISAAAIASQNEQIQIDINAIRTAISRSGFKTRFAAVLMSDKSILHAPEVEDRLSSIRRATTLDPKTGLFFMPPMSSQAEISTFVQSLLATLQPLCVEYYRDLTKHARRKKARGGPLVSVTSPIGGGSQSLSTSGWNVRYEIKQGVFAEFRQEMDVAERHYSTAVEELFNAEGIFENTPSWSPKWDEARLLCDVIALRVVRCQLFVGLTSGAVTSWVNYQARMRDLIDRRGKGSLTYSWSAGEARWARIMAQLVQRAGVPAIQIPTRRATDESVQLVQQQVYAQPEKPAERLPPFQYLHHPGYWLRLCAKAIQVRRERALAILEEDRIPPGQSPASAVAKRMKNYDAYMVPDPHVEYSLLDNEGYDHVAEFDKISKKAMLQFDLRNQLRLAGNLRLELARELVDVKRYRDAMDTLLPLYEDTTWRAEDWHNMFAALLSLLHTCAGQEDNAEAILATTWESLAIKPPLSPLSHSDLAKCLDNLGRGEPKVFVKFENRRRLSPVTISFAFENKYSHVGELLECQLILSSSAPDTSPPMVLSRTEVILSNSKTVKIVHKSDGQQVKNEVWVDLSGTSEIDGGSLVAEADLTLLPQQTRHFSFFLEFRDAETIGVRQATIVIETEKYELQHVFTESRLYQSPVVFMVNDGVLNRRLLPYAEPSAVTILPKAPKVHLSCHDLRKQYYTDERVRLQIELLNDEAETIDGAIKGDVVGAANDDFGITWDDADSDASEYRIEALASSTSRKTGLTLKAGSHPTVISLAIEVKYTLATGSEATLTKSLTMEMEFVSAFDAKFSFAPLLNIEPWPSYFNGEARGIVQRWRIGSQVHSLGAEKIVIRRMKLTMDSDPEEADCNLPHGLREVEQALEPSQTIEAEFELCTQKWSLDDRRATTVGLWFEIEWSRDSASDATTTTVPVPRLALPSSEPRVLCTVAETNTDDNEIEVHYHLENPSAHFLTFALTMEASDDFAFSGPKHRTLALAPLSRHRVAYRLIVHDRNDATSDETLLGEDRWIWPALQVLDSYYQKKLKVHSGSSKVRLDERLGIGIQVV